MAESGSPSLEELVQSARALVRPGHRTILGITGFPGSGKSTLGALLVDALGSDAALLSMDGFHLAERELHRLGRQDRKGAPDTFDAAGFVALLRRVREAKDPVVYAPAFDRSIEESIAGAIPIPADTPLIITEGNYLLVADEAWSPVADLLDECWFVDIDHQVRLERLIDRHIAFGRDRAAAIERSTGSDQSNADVITATQLRATRVVHVPLISQIAK